MKAIREMTIKEEIRMRVSIKVQVFLQIKATEKVEVGVIFIEGRIGKIQNMTQEVLLIKVEGARLRY